MFLFYPDDTGSSAEVPWECDDTGSDYGCYVFRGPENDQDSLTFDNAKAECERIGGQLATAKSAQEVEDLAVFIRKFVVHSMLDTV